MDVHERPEWQPPYEDIVKQEVSSDDYNSLEEQMSCHTDEYSLDGENINSRMTDAGSLRYPENDDVAINLSMPRIEEVSKHSKDDSSDDGAILQHIKTEPVDYTEDESTDVADADYPSNLQDQQNDDHLSQNKDDLYGIRVSIANKQNSPKKVFYCAYCSKEFNRKDQCQVHEMEHTGDRPFTCSFCGKGFTRKEQCKIHERIHTGEKPYTCKYCNTSFNQLSNYKAHVMHHTGIKPFTCQHCGKAFTSKSKCQRHEYTHVTDKPFKCTFCEKSFSQNFHLQAHMRHHTGDKFKCDLCDQEFITRHNLTTHQQIHSGVKPHKCTHCDKAFMRKPDLKKHLMIHSGDRPYKCTYCGKSFNQKGNCFTHERRHVGDHPWKCHYCDKTFVLKEPRDRHEKIHFKDGEMPPIINEVAGPDEEEKAGKRSVNKFLKDDSPPPFQKENTTSPSCKEEVVNETLAPLDVSNKA